MLRLFTEHPATVGETYPEHMYRAFAFGLAMIISGCACIIHGMLPFLFAQTGSNTIKRLHDHMLLNRHK